MTIVIEPLTLQQFFDVIEYKVTEGYKYQWSCYPDARGMSYWDENPDGVQAEVLFSTKNQTVYEATIHDYKNDVSYRWLNEKWSHAYFDEANSKGCDFKQAYDGVNFIDLITPEDYLEKTSAILAGKEYDSRIIVPLELDEDVINILTLEAEKSGVSFDDYMNVVLERFIDLHKDLQTE